MNKEQLKAEILKEVYTYSQGLTYIIDEQIKRKASNGYPDFHGGYLYSSKFNLVIKILVTNEYEFPQKYNVLFEDVNSVDEVPDWIQNYDITDNFEIPVFFEKMYADNINGQIGLSLMRYRITFDDNFQFEMKRYEKQEELIFDTEYGDFLELPSEDLLNRWNSVDRTDYYYHDWILNDERAVEADQVLKKLKQNPSSNPVALYNLKCLLKCCREAFETDKQSRLVSAIRKYLKNKQ